MTRLLRAGLVVALLASLLAAAGCGSDAKKSNDYVNAINKAQTEFAASISKAQTGTGTGAQGAADTFSNMKAAIDKVISDLNGITPPDKVKDLHADLIGELKSFDSSVAKAGDALKAKDPTAILKAQSTFAQDASTVASKIGTTINAINTKLHE